MAWEDHEELSSLENRSLRYKFLYYKEYKHEDIVELAYDVLRPNSGYDKTDQERATKFLARFKIPLPGDANID